MVCTFFGHHDTPNSIKPRLKKVILNLLEAGADWFYVGNNGRFDLLVQATLMEIEKERAIKYSIVLSYVNERAISGNQGATIFAQGQETACPRFAISKRNEWLLKKSDVVVAYATNKCSNTYKLIEKSNKKGKTVINLSNTNI